MRNILLTITLLGCMLGTYASNAQTKEHNSVDEQTARAKAIYKTAKKGKQKHAITDDGDFIWGLNYNMFTGGSSSPYSHAFGFYNIREALFAKRHVQFQFLTRFDYLTGGRREWFSKVFEAPVTRVPATGRVGIGISFAAVVVDKQNCGVSVGPAAGIFLGLMPGVDVAGSNEYDFPLLFTPTWGLQGNVYLAKHFYAGAAFSVATRSTFYNGATATPMNDNFFSISLGIRGFGDPGGSYHDPYSGRTPYYRPHY